MKIDEFMRALERAQAYAYPGREAVEREAEEDWGNLRWR
jgi:hypothetical protein